MGARAEAFEDGGRATERAVPPGQLIEQAVARAREHWLSRAGTPQGGNLFHDMGASAPSPARPRPVKAWYRDIVTSS